MGGVISDCRWTVPPRCLGSSALGKGSCQVERRGPGGEELLANSTGVGGELGNSSSSSG